MRLVALSDTHGYHKKLTIPEGDVFIHAGDFSMKASTEYLCSFSSWVNKLPHKHKIIIAGNHDMACEQMGRLQTKEIFSPAIYLDHEYCQIDDVMFFGSPYTSYIDEPSSWFFDYPRNGELAHRLWGSLIDAEKINVLITHGPPYGILDKVSDPHEGEDPHVGEKYLLDVIRNHMPKVHIFGHIHEGYGNRTYYHPLTNATTTMYNVSVCTELYRPTNPISVIDLTK